MTLKSLLTTLAIVAIAATTGKAADKPAEGAPRIACVGDSITAGAGSKKAATDSYPAQLAKMLGEKYEVKNFGVGGSTLLNHGDKPYQKQKAFDAALKFNPNIVVIMLGTNDTKPQNWKFKDEFDADYKDLIGKFAALETKPKIYVCKPCPVPGKGNFGIVQTGVTAEGPMIEKIAADTKSTIIDVGAAFEGKDALFPDRVHPNNEGYTVLAGAIYKGLTGSEYKEAAK